MARGFNTTHGVATTDRIASAYTAQAVTRSWAIWTYRAGSGGTNIGRIFEKRTGATESEWLAVNSTNYRFKRNRATTDGIWDTAMPSLNAWHHVGISYDSSSTSNDPVAYIDGSSQSVTEITGPPAGAVTDNADPYILGNRPADDACWDGMLAEFAIWDAILTGGEFAALASGLSPLFVRPAVLVEYMPLIGPITSYMVGGATVTGTAIQPHPRSYYPPMRRRRSYVAAAAAGGRPVLVGGKLTSSLLLGGLAR
jgi:hypothetical protein